MKNADNSYTLTFKDGRIRQFNASGKREGVQTYKYENGEVAIQGNFVNGKETGTIKEFHENGQLKAEKKYNDGNVDVASIKTYESTDKVVKKAEDLPSNAPKIAVGRLAASTPQQVDDYLQKVQQYESAPKAMWMKNVLHFAGGTSLGEQNQFLYFLDEYKKIYRDTLFGGNVTTFKKTSVDPIQITQSDSIRALIEGGVSFMNFFGHAAGSSFDVSPEPPSAYNNQGKYPIVMANSCNVGDLHQPPTATYQFISEEYIFAQQRGAIAFLAQSKCDKVGVTISMASHASINCARDRNLFT